MQDAMRPPGPASLEEAISASWLTAALRTRYPDIEVVSVTAGTLVSRVATNAAVTIECAGGVPEGLSPHLFVKGYFTEVGGAFRAAGVPEVLFYRDLVDAIGVHTLPCVYADLDPATLLSVVITEDVAVHGADFLDARRSLRPAQVAQSLEDLAKLHAATWMQPRYAELPWLASRLWQYTGQRGAADIAANFDGPIGAGVPSGVRDVGRLFDTYSALGRQVRDESPWCVVHGDSHIGNVFVDRAGRPCFVDWQLTQCGPWYLDVGYHLASALTIEDRRAHERELVDRYVAVLAAHGVALPGDTDIWRGVRRGMVHGLYLWAITLKVMPEITSQILTRLGTAVADHDAYAAVNTEENS